MTYRKQIIPDAPQSYEDKLVREHGELIDRKTAGRILNRNPDTVARYIKDGHFQTAPNGDVVVRSLAQWITCNPTATKPRKMVVLP